MIARATKFPTKIQVTDSNLNLLSFSLIMNADIAVALETDRRIERRIHIGNHLFLEISEDFRQTIMENQPLYLATLKQPSMQETQQILLNALCLHIQDEKGSCLSISDKLFTNLTQKPHFIVLENCNLKEVAVFANSGEKQIPILGIKSIIQRVEAPQNFDASYDFPVAEGLQIQSIHQISYGHAQDEDHKSSLMIHGRKIDIIQTDAMLVHISEIDQPILLMHMQANEAKFFMKSSIIRFDRNFIQDYLPKTKFKGRLGKLIQYFRFYLLKGLPYSPDANSMFLELQENQKFLENTIKKIKETSGALISDEDFHRYLYYFNSRSGRLKRSLYWFNGAYYNIGWPLLFTALIFVGLCTCLAFSNRPLSEISILAELKGLFGSYLFADFDIINGKLSIPKILFGLLLIPFYYSGFCLVLAVKRKFGFPNELR